MTAGDVLVERRSLSAVGQPVRNIDWDAKTSGSAVFTGDLRPDDLLHARIVRSTHPHAWIVGVDATAAAAVTGVVAVVTAADFADARYVHHGGPLADRPVLASDKVRYVGEEIAGVAAETLAAADEAVRRFEVRYASIEAVTDVAAASRPGAPAVHDGKEGNVAVAVSRRWGDPDARGAEVAVSGTYAFARQTHACMEPSSVVARWDPDRGRLSVWTATQAPYMVRKELSGVLGLDVDQIEMHEVAVGGGFGARSKICEFEAIACKLSIKSARPVRLVLTRDEEFATTKCRHNLVVDLTTSATASGDLHSRRAAITVDNGAYNHSGPSVMGYATLVLGSLYRTEGVQVDGRLVYTNKHPGGQFRGYGAPQATFAIESQMDELADALGARPDRPADPQRQSARRRHPYRLEAGVGAARRMPRARARDAIGWDEKRPWQGSGPRRRRRRGDPRQRGATSTSEPSAAQRGRRLRADGRCVVRFGGADAGTGQQDPARPDRRRGAGPRLDEFEVRDDGAPTGPPRHGRLVFARNLHERARGGGRGPSRRGSVARVGGGAARRGPRGVDHDGGRARGASGSIGLAESRRRGR